MEKSVPAKMEQARCSNKQQLSLALTKLEGTEDDRGYELNVGELSSEVQARVGVIQRVIGARGGKQYAQVQQEAAGQLGMSVRSLRRLVRSWQEEGIAGLTRQERSDAGALKISEEWQEFIVKTYQEGNRGSRRMSAAQVFIRVKVQAQERGEGEYPSRATVYRVLKPYVEKVQAKRSLGWRGGRLLITTREGTELVIEWSNQVWQCDHTRADVLIVDQSGSILGRPWLTTVVDTYSRCIMGIHLGFDAPSAAVVCLALRHAILPKQYSGAYELKQIWGTYGLPQYLYTDGGKDFRSQHLEQVATELGIVLCLRRKPSDGGIVERPFGTLNTQFFSTLPGYVSSDVSTRSSKAESEACLTLLQLEKLLVRYLVDHYNQGIDARMGDQSRIGRWEAGRIAQLSLLGERELDICLMRRDRRTVYRNGYLQFANLTYQGEHLAGYAGERVVMRYNPRDITTVFIYQPQEGKEVFLARAHAQGLETECLSYAEAQAIARQIRASGKVISNQSVLSEVRDREVAIEKLQRQKRQKTTVPQPLPEVPQPPVNSTPDRQQNQTELEGSQPCVADYNEASIEGDIEPMKPKKPVPYVRVYESYDEIEREWRSQ
jgi:putative transposase